MKNYNAKNVDEYIASSSKESRPKLKELRKIIKSTIPKAEESISWGVPFYKYKGLLAGYSALKNSVIFGLAFHIEDKYRGPLEEKGYKTGMKSFQIQFNQKVPKKEIILMLKEQAKINEAKQ